MLHVIKKIVHGIGWISVVNPMFWFFYIVALLFRELITGKDKGDVDFFKKAIHVSGWIYVTIVVIWFAGTIKESMPNSPQIPTGVRDVPEPKMPDVNEQSLPQINTQPPQPIVRTEAPPPTIQVSVEGYTILTKNPFDYPVTVLLTYNRYSKWYGVDERGVKVTRQIPARSTDSYADPVMDNNSGCQRNIGDCSVNSATYELVGNIESDNQIVIVS
jgi:hypothetical protein